MRAVDLLQQDLKRRGQRPAWMPLALLAAAIVVAGAATAIVYSRAEARVAGNQSQRAALQRQLALAEAAAQPAASRAVDPQTSSLRDAVLAVLGERQNWGGLLRGMGRVMPPGSWLTKLSISESGAATEPAPATPPPAEGPPAATEATNSATPPAAGASTTTAAAAGAGEVAFSLSGCALSQALVGQAVNGINRLPGVGEVSASSSEGGECGRYPSFQLSFGIAGSAS